MAMESRIVDRRKSILSLGIERIHIAGSDYVLQGEPKRGGSCLVYTAIKTEQVGDTVYEHRVLLKEFYPLLGMGQTAGILRDQDGSLQVPETTRCSEDYKRNLKRFQASYGMMLELGRTETGAEHTTVAVSMMEDNGTWYMEEAYDTGESLDVFVGKWQLDLKDFLNVFYRCLEAVGRLHRLGYYHLDLKPQNISCTRNIVIKLIDTDSFVQISRLSEYKVLSWTRGYSAPELESAIRSPEDMPYLIGPWTDVFSLAQILCWYLFGHPLEEEEKEAALDQLEKAVEKRLIRIESLPDGDMSERTFSMKGVYMLRQILSDALNPRWKQRPSSVSALKDALVDAYNELFAPEAGAVLVDNFHIPDVIGYVFEKRIGQLETLFEYGDYAGVAILSDDQGKRKALAYTYGAVRRMDYQCIMELHCKSFTDIPGQFFEHKRKTYELVYPVDSLEGRGIYIWYANRDRLKSWLTDCDLPVLLIIFDEREEDVLDKEEAVIMKELLELPACDWLIVGQYNRCRSRNKLQYDIRTLDLDQENEQPMAPKTYEKRVQRRRIALAAHLAVACILAWMGRWLALLGASQAVPAYKVFETEEFVYFALRQDFAPESLIYVAGAVLAYIGILCGLYGMYRYYRPYGWKMFLQKYAFAIGALFAFLLTLAVPEAYVDEALSWVMDRYGIAWYQTYLVERMALGLLYCMGAVFLILWLWHICFGERSRSRWLQAAAALTWMFSAGFAVLQTWVNRGEMVFLIICLAVDLAATLCFLRQKKPCKEQMEE